MKLEEQVVSLELAKRLKELNCRQDSIFRWSKYCGAYYVEYENTGSGSKICSAYTVSELGEMLPAWMHFTKGETGWSCSYLTSHSGLEEDINFDDKTEANARAKMLCWLIREGEVKV